MLTLALLMASPAAVFFCRADDRKPVFAGDCALRAGGIGGSGGRCAVLVLAGLCRAPRRTAAGAGGAGTGGRMAPGESGPCWQVSSFLGPHGGGAGLTWAEPGVYGPWNQYLAYMPVGALGQKTPVFTNTALPFGLYGQLVSG